MMGRGIKNFIYGADSEINQAGNSIDQYTWIYTQVVAGYGTLSSLALFEFDYATVSMI